MEEHFQFHAIIHHYIAKRMRDLLRDEVIEFMMVLFVLQFLAYIAMHFHTAMSVSTQSKKMI